MAQSYCVPEKLVYYSRPQQRVTKNVRDQEELIFVRKTYAVDATSEASKKSAEQWAKQPEHEWVNGKYVVKEQPAPQIIERDNTPFNYIEIYNIEYGAEGRVVFKVVTDDGYAFDVRLPEMFEMLMRCGSDVGGRINGKFIWVRMGSQYRITCVNSPTHKKCLEGQAAKKKTDGLKPLKAKELVIGGIYQNKNDDTYLYAGKLDKYHWFYSPYVSGYLVPGNWSSGSSVCKWLKFGDSFTEIKELVTKYPHLDFRAGLRKANPIPTIYTKVGQINIEDVEWLKIQPTK